MDSLKHLIGFRQFLSFNGIDDESLKMVRNSLNIRV